MPGSASSIAKMNLFDGNWDRLNRKYRKRMQACFQTEKSAYLNENPWTNHQLSNQGIFTIQMEKSSKCQRCDRFWGNKRTKNNCCSLLFSQFSLDYHQWEKKSLRAKGSQVGGRRAKLDFCCCCFEKDSQYCLSRMLPSSSGMHYIRKFKGPKNSGPLEKSINR